LEEEKMTDFGRVLTAMVTPFQADGSVDYAEAVRLADYLIQNGTDSLVLHGTTGESPTMSHEEEYELYRTIKKALGNKTKIVAGSGSNSTATSIHSTKMAEELGLDGAMIVVPYYNRPTQAGLVAHYTAIANSTKLPIIIYNIPGRTGTNMLPETVVQLSKIRNIGSIKEAAGSVDQVKALRAVLPKDFVIYSGDDGLTLPFMAEGAYGVISVASHCAGKMIHQMVDAYAAGKIADAEALQEKLMPLFKVLFIETNPAPVKAACRMMGFKVGKPRLPIVDVTPDLETKIKKVLQDLGVVK
jgi:4-hydroxy-tetrahydrodipicolinate synthase